MSTLTFSGHETFHCRHFWLKKGYDFLINNHRFVNDTAVVELGVGKNMVTAIRYWLRAFEIIDERDEPQKFANYFFANDGRDPYLENNGTLWLFHYLLVTRARASIYSLVFNEFRKERIEFNKEHLNSFIKRKCEENSHAYNTNTIKNDINVFLKTYIRPQKNTKNIEDDFSGLLIDLDLLQRLDGFESDSGSGFKIESKERQEIPIEIFLFSLLDNDQYGNSISFNELLNGYNSVGMVYAMNASGLMAKIEDVISNFPGVTFTEDAGLRELQFKEKPDKWEILNLYYHEN